ncbi:MAG: hypothetical protein HZA48_02370 [Planctomycetes bacterium]|nr:hypothetical protein [Planctomycetota bacterium]
MFNTAGKILFAMVFIISLMVFTGCGKGQPIDPNAITNTAGSGTNTESGTNTGGTAGGSTAGGDTSGGTTTGTDTGSTTGSGSSTGDSGTTTGTGSTGSTGGSTTGSTGSTGSGTGSSGSGTSTGGTTTSTATSDYVIYEVTQTSNKSYKASINSANIVILPSAVSASANMQAVGNASVTFSDGTTISTGDDSGFDKTEIPEGVILDAYSDPANQPSVTITTASGDSAMTTISVEMEDDASSATNGDNGKGDQPIGLELVPETFSINEGGMQILHALRINANGKVIKATNVTWEISPADYSANLVPDESDSSYAVFTAPSDILEENLDVTITATILSDSLEISDSSVGFVANDAYLVKIYGILYNTDGVTVMANTLLGVDLPQVPGLKPFFFTDITDMNGMYEIYVPATPMGLVDGDKYRIFVDSDLEGKKHLVKGLNMATGDPFIVVYQLETEKNVNVKKTDISFFVPEPTPVKKVIRYAAWQVRNAVQRLVAEPHNRVRELFDGETVPNPINFGILKGWSWEWIEDPTYDLLLTSPDLREHIYVVESSTDHYTYRHEILPYLYNTVYPTDWIKIAEGEWVDTFESTVLIQIVNTIYHYLPGKDTPHRTTVVAWTPGSSDLSSTLMVDNYYGNMNDADSKKINHFEVAREFNGFEVIGTNADLFTYGGSGIAYFYPPVVDATLPAPDSVQVTNSFAGNLTGKFGGDFALVDTTLDGPHNGDKVEIHVLSVAEKLTQANTDLQKIATGSIKKLEEDDTFTTVCTFDIFINGVIKVYAPEDTNHTEPKEVINE